MTSNIHASPELNSNPHNADRIHAAEIQDELAYYLLSATQTNEQADSHSKLDPTEVYRRMHSVATIARSLKLAGRNMTDVATFFSDPSVLLTSTDQLDYATDSYATAFGLNQRTAKAHMIDFLGAYSSPNSAQEPIDFPIGRISVFTQQASKSKTPQELWLNYCEQSTASIVAPKKPIPVIQKVVAVEQVAVQSSETAPTRREAFKQKISGFFGALIAKINPIKHPASPAEAAQVQPTEATIAPATNIEALATATEPTARTRRTMLTPSRTGLFDEEALFAARSRRRAEPVASAPIKPADPTIDTKLEHESKTLTPSEQRRQRHALKERTSNTKQPQTRRYQSPARPHVPTPETPGSNRVESKRHWRQGAARVGAAALMLVGLIGINNRESDALSETRTPANIPTHVTPEAPSTLTRTPQTQSTSVFGAPAESISIEPIASSENDRQTYTISSEGGDRSIWEIAERIANQHAPVTADLDQFTADVFSHLLVLPEVAELENPSIVYKGFTVTVDLQNIR